MGDFKVRRCWSHFMRYEIERLRSELSELSAKKLEDDPARFFRGPWGVREIIFIPFKCLAAVLSLPFFLQDRAAHLRKIKAIEQQILRSEDKWDDSFESAETIAEVWNFTVATSRFIYREHEKIPLLRLFVAELYDSQVADRIEPEKILYRIRNNQDFQSGRLETEGIHVRYGDGFPEVIDYIERILPPFRGNDACRRAMFALHSNIEDKN